MMNPPFALKKEDEKEFTFVEHALNQMIDGGTLLTVLPISVMYGSGKEFSWRKRLIGGSTLSVVMSLPTDLWYPQVSVETCIVIIRKGVPQGKNSCLFVKFHDDGYIKKKKRRLLHKNDSQTGFILEQVRNHLNAGRVVESRGILQCKLLDETDPDLEFTPQRYLDAEAVDDDRLASLIFNTHRGIVLQRMKGDIL